MDLAGEVGFPRAALSRQEQGDVKTGNFPDLREKGFHRWVVAFEGWQLGGFRFSAMLPGWPVAVDPVALPFDRFVDNREKLLKIEWLGYIIVGSCAQGPDGCFRVVMAGKHNNRNIGKFHAYAVENVNAIRIGQPVVEDDCFDVFADQRKRRRAVVRSDRSPASALGCDGEKACQRIVVIDQQQI